MSVLIDLIRNNSTYVTGKKAYPILTTILTGRTLTTPALIYTDGINVTYGVDVDIGREAIIDDNGTVGNLPLYNVPISNGNRSLVYAQIGSAVTLQKTSMGWEVVGFAKTYTGSFSITGIELPLYCLRVPTENLPGDPILHTPVIGETRQIGIEARKLTLGELADYGGGFGVICFGASATFIGGDLTAITCGT